MMTDQELDMITDMLTVQIRQQEYINRLQQQVLFLQQKLRELQERLGD